MQLLLGPFFLGQTTFPEEFPYELGLSFLLVLSKVVETFQYIARPSGSDL
jgi:hypothetical protein